MPDALVFRPARADDLAALVAIFAADTLGGHPDTTDPRAFPLYQAAFAEIVGDPRERLIVGEIDGRPVATAQLTFNRGLPHLGRRRATIEAVQVAPDRRGEGIGAALIRHMIGIARAEGAKAVDLTSNAARVDAHRFYERLGFAKSHFGFKLALD